VDAEGQVHGISGLRVADASIFPTNPRANVHFTTVAVAERIAAVVRGETVRETTHDHTRSWEQNES
jgi:choline dehydrogenase